MKEEGDMEAIEKINAVIDEKTQVLNEDEVNVLKDTSVDIEYIKEQAKKFLGHIEGKDAHEIRDALEGMVVDDIEELENSSKLLEVKLGELETIEDTHTNEVAKSLRNLSSTVSNIDPRKKNFVQKGFFSFLPFIQSPINKYLKKFKSASSIISGIIQNLDDADQLLRNDNVILQNDKDRYRKAAIELQRKALIMQYMIEAIENQVDSLNEEERAFYINNLVLHLQKKVRSIYEILLVTQEGFLSNDFIINTNWELIDNIQNVKMVTKRALDIGVSMLVALENQKNVLDAVEQTREVTNNLIVGNAQRMNNQGTEIYQRAGKATIDIGVLKEAFENIDEALSKINKMKEDALVQAKTEVETMQKISNNLEGKIKEAQRIEKLKAVKISDSDERSE